MTNKDLLGSTGNSAQCSVAWVERESGEGWIHGMHAWGLSLSTGNITTLLISYALIQSKKLKKIHKWERKFMLMKLIENLPGTPSVRNISVTCCSCWFGARDPNQMQKKLMHSFGDPRCFLASLENRSPWLCQEGEYWLSPPACKVSLFLSWLVAFWAT